MYAAAGFDKLDTSIYFQARGVMRNQQVIEEVTAKIKDMLGQSPTSDIEKNLRAVLQSVFNKLDLVTREEFEVQQAVLLRTREKLELLETQVVSMEKQGSGNPA